ncbi:MAG TPA: hypothetical protein VKV24_05090 [Casimicrobiaceae bacterium]|nr:hypothetical protein [Casimicrobiaceae bacterium]
MPFKRILSAMALWLFAAGALAQVNLAVNGVVVDTLSADGTGLADTNWVRHTYSGSAVGSSTTLEFRATGTSDSLDGFIDDVRLFDTGATTPALPVPATSLPVLVLVALALAALGASSRRRA